MENTVGTGAQQTLGAKKNWFAAHKILSIIIAVIIVAVIGTALGGGSKSSDSAKKDSSTSQSADSSASSTQSETAKEEAAALGTPVTVGDFSVTVTKVTPGITRVGNEYLGENPQGQFVTVDLTVTNNGKEASYFSQESLKIVDNQDREHSPSSKAAIYLKDNALFTEINPGNTLSGTAIFDIPADASVKNIKISSGLFGKDVIVNVG